MMAPATVSGAVLIGGRSRRMGESKALLRLHPNGPTLVEFAVDAVREVADDVMLVGRADWPIPTTLADLRQVVDDGNGAADGVIAALRASRHESCIVVGCDMPFLDVALLREMIAIVDQESTGVIASDATGLHPLHAVWRRADLSRIEAMVAAGERSLSAIASELGMVRVTADAPERGGMGRWSVFNANTPAELAIAREHARQHNP